MKRAQYLNDMLYKYALSWGQNTPNRMLGWADEYNDIKKLHPEAWKIFCQRTGATLDHNAGDVLA